MVNLPMLNIPTLKFPRLSLRLFIYLIFILVLLALLVEGGYYFWVQREVKKQSKNPAIAREEGVFSYVNLPDGTTQKVILGKIEKIDGNLLTIKTDNNKTAQVLFTGGNVRIADLTSGVERSRLRVGTIEDLLIGDKVTVAETYANNEGRIEAKSLVIVRGVYEY